MGTLRIHGTIDISQFWPVGSADADTTKIKLTVKDNSFEYKEEGSAKFKPTHVFKGAISKGQGSTSVIKTSKRDGSQTITVRLQGVDAPELHYKASPLKRSSKISDEERKKFNSLNEERRQCYAESATCTLVNYLKPYANSKGMVAAVFTSFVSQPFEVIDTYGRFIGNVIINKKQDINLWLVENGWGFPTFYTSMLEDEIELFLTAWKKGKAKKGSIVKSSSKDANLFDWDMHYREPKTVKNFKIGEDKGKVLMPKIFRRQTAWMVSKKAGVITSGTDFQTYLKKSPDQLFLLDEFLEHGIHSATTRALHDFISSKNLVLKNAEELIFKEKSGTLVDSKGKKVTKWK